MTYKKGDKFIIEIAEKHTHYNDEGKPYTIYRIKGFNSLVFDNNGLNKLSRIIGVDEMFEEKEKEIDEVIRKEGK